MLVRGTTLGPVRSREVAPATFDPAHWAALHPALDALAGPGFVVRGPWFLGRGRPQFGVERLPLGLAFHTVSTPATRHPYGPERGCSCFTWSGQRATTQTGSQSQLPVVSRCPRPLKRQAPLALAAELADVCRWLGRRPVRPPPSRWRGGQVLCSLVRMPAGRARQGPTADGAASPRRFARSGGSAPE
jgi:hypothetical protein